MTVSTDVRAGPFVVTAFNAPTQPVVGGSTQTVTWDVANTDVLTDAVEAQVKSLPGVNGASAVLRGSAERPDLTLRVTADDRTDISGLLVRLHDQVAADLGDALDTRLSRFGVQVEVAAGKSETDHITL